MKNTNYSKANEIRQTLLLFVDKEILINSKKQKSLPSKIFENFSETKICEYFCYKSNETSILFTNDTKKRNFKSSVTEELSPPTCSHSNVTNIEKIKINEQNENISSEEKKRTKEKSDEEKLVKRQSSTLTIKKKIKYYKKYLLNLCNKLGKNNNKKNIDNKKNTDNKKIKQTKNNKVENAKDDEFQRTFKAYHSGKQKQYDIKQVIIKIEPFTPKNVKKTYSVKSILKEKNTSHKKSLFNKK